MSGDEYYNSSQRQRELRDPEPQIDPAVNEFFSEVLFDDTIRNAVIHAARGQENTPEARILDDSITTTIQEYSQYQTINLTHLCIEEVGTEFLNENTSTRIDRKTFALALLERTRWQEEIPPHQYGRFWRWYIDALTRQEELQSQSYENLQLLLRAGEVLSQRLRLQINEDDRTLIREKIRALISHLQPSERDEVQQSIPVFLRESIAEDTTRQEEVTILENTEPTKALITLSEEDEKRTFILQQEESAKIALETFAQAVNEPFTYIQGSEPPMNLLKKLYAVNKTLTIWIMHYLYNMEHKDISNNFNSSVGSVNHEVAKAEKLYRSEDGFEHTQEVYNQTIIALRTFAQHNSLELDLATLADIPPWIVINKLFQENPYTAVWILINFYHQRSETVRKHFNIHNNLFYGSYKGIGSERRLPAFLQRYLTTSINESEHT